MQKNFGSLSKKRWTCKTRLSSSAIPVLAVALTLPFAGGQQTKPNSSGKKTTKAQASTVPDGPPMTLPALVTMLGAIKKGIMDQARILEFVNKRNIDFDATPANVSTLMN